MGASVTIKQILIEKKMTLAMLAEACGKARSTVANTFATDNLQVSNLLDYAEALNCEVVIRDKENGHEYKIYR